MSEKLVPIPKPHLIVLDETDGPGLRIQQWCDVCHIAVTEHAIDVSKVLEATEGDKQSIEWWSAELGLNDGLAWNAHIATKHGAGAQ
jgi:hypothetical protein